MNARERVIAVIRHEQPDRVPIYGWVSANLSEAIEERFGSVAAFEDHYEFDFAHLFGGPPAVASATLEETHNAVQGAIDPVIAAEMPFTDPDAQDAYADITAQIQHHKRERERFVYVQTPGIFEALNGVFGIENHLMYLMMYPRELAVIYRRQAEWNRRFAMNCLDLGVDMVHVSDDWGAQRNLMFSTDTWWDLIYPNHKITADAVKKRGAFLSLHSDGNINSVVDGVIALGYDVVHPWQESAGMSLRQFRDRYRGRFTVMGGLDVQDTIGFGNYEALAASIQQVPAMFREGGLLYCTTHFVQAHCSMDELIFAFDLIYKTVRKS